MKKFVTVLDRSIDQFPGGLMWSWNRPQRATKEWNVRKHCGIRPLYRVNIRLKSHARRCASHEGFICDCLALMQEGQA